MNESSSVIEGSEVNPIAVISIRSTNGEQCSKRGWSSFIAHENSFRIEVSNSSIVIECLCTSISVSNCVRNTSILIVLSGIYWKISWEIEPSIVLVILDNFAVDFISSESDIINCLFIWESLNVGCSCILVSI